MRLLTLGDSLTQGVGDPTPERAGFSGQLDGWVTHLSRALQASGRTVAVTNLAVSGPTLTGSDGGLGPQLSYLLPRVSQLQQYFLGVLPQLGCHLSGLRRRTAHA